VEIHVKQTGTMIRYCHFCFR